MSGELNVDSQHPPCWALTLGVPLHGRTDEFEGWANSGYPNQFLLANPKSRPAASVGGTKHGTVPSFYEHKKQVLLKSNQKNMVDLLRAHDPGGVEGGVEDFSALPPPSFSCCFAG